MKRAFAIAILGAVVFGTGPNVAGAQALKKIRIGYPSLSFRQSNVWVATEMKLFHKYGLEVEPIFLRGGQMATQALVAGDPPIVNIGTVVQASLRGHNLVLVAAEMRFMGVRFRELSFSVLVAGSGAGGLPLAPAPSPEGRGRTVGGAYLVQAFNSCRCFAFCERALFSTPYNHGDVRVVTDFPASIRLLQSGEAVFAAEMAAAPAAGGTGVEAVSVAAGPLHSRWISSRPIGPRRYDSVHRVSKIVGRFSWTLCSRKTRLPSDDNSWSRFARSKPSPELAATPSSPSSTRALSRSVWRRPSIHVPQFESAL